MLVIAVAVRSVRRDEMRGFRGQLNERTQTSTILFNTVKVNSDIAAVIMGDTQYISSVWIISSALARLASYARFQLAGRKFAT